MSDLGAPATGTEPQANRAQIDSYIDLAGIIERLEQEDPTRILAVGFNNPHSFRGYYDQLAFELAWDIPIGDVLAAAQSAVGETYEGYKGGQYTMSGHTDCWIAEWGASSDNKIGPLLLELMLRPAGGA